MPSEIFRRHFFSFSPKPPFQHLNFPHCRTFRAINQVIRQCYQTLDVGNIAWISTTGSQADSGMLVDYRHLRRVRICATRFAALFVNTSRLRLFQP